MNTHYLPTEPQIEYVRSLQRRINLSDSGMDIYCTHAYGVPLAQMTRPQVSSLINAMKDWKDIPPEVRRAMGQLDMFGEAS